MYVIIVYDVDVKRVNKIHKFLRRFLYWRQNSVFEGDIRESDFQYVLMKLNELIKDEDNVIIYTFEKPYLKVVELGKPKSNVNNNII
jgi:CRISPR-associated protein Cas2